MLALLCICILFGWLGRCDRILIVVSLPLYFIYDGWELLLPGWWNLCPDIILFSVDESRSKGKQDRVVTHFISDC